VSFVFGYPEVGNEGRRSRLQMTGPECRSSIARIRLAFGLSAAFRVIEFADRVTANFDDAVLRAFLRS
jgi:hypothetical protein